MKRCLTYLMLFALIIVNTPALPRVRATSTCPEAACVYVPVVIRSVPLVTQHVLLAELRSPDYRIIGEVVNTSTIPLSNAVIETRLFGRADALVAVITGTTQLTTTFPGQINPFYYNLGGTWAFPEILRAEAVVVRWSEIVSPQLRPVTVVAVEIEPQGGLFLVHATLRNDQSVSLRNVRGMVWTYPMMFLYGIPRFIVTDRLAPGETIIWTQEFALDNCTICEPRFNVQGIASGP
jgi:hypothetical protein